MSSHRLSMFNITILRFMYTIYDIKYRHSPVSPNMEDPKLETCLRSVSTRRPLISSRGHLISTLQYGRISDEGFEGKFCCDKRIIHMYTHKILVDSSYRGTDQETAKMYFLHASVLRIRGMQTYGGTHFE